VCVPPSKPLRRQESTASPVGLAPDEPGDRSGSVPAEQQGEQLQARYQRLWVPTSTVTLTVKPNLMNL
jgi:hypothetical protein